MKIIVTLLLSVVSFLSATAARNLVPEEIRQSKDKYSEYYVVTGDNGAKGYEITKQGLSSIKFEQGDTVYVLKIVDLESDKEFQRLASKVSLKGYVAFIVLSLDKYGLVELDHLERADMRTQEELAGDQAVEELESFLHGDNSYPYSAPYSLLAFLVSTVVCRILTSKKCCENEMLGKICLWGAVAILLVTFWFQYQLFVNGELVLSNWVKAGHTKANLLFMLKFFAKGSLLFAFAIWEIALMYRVLRRLGDVCSGRTNYKFPVLIWTVGTVAMAVVLLWFKEYSITVAYVLSGLFVLDLLISLLLNRRNVPIMVATGALYGLGLWALIPTFVNACFLFFIVLLTILAMSVVLIICQPATVVGYVRNSLGSRVGEVMSDGRVRLTGGKEFHISNLRSGYTVERNDD